MASTAQTTGGVAECGNHDRQRRPDCLLNAGLQADGSRRILLLPAASSRSPVRITCVPVHISDRNRLEKERRALQFGVSDLDQARAAAQMLQNTSDLALARALETAIVVCFMRPFTNRDVRLPEGWLPPAEDQSDDALAFRALDALRDKVYAHTDRDSGREAGPITVEEGEIVNIRWQEEWLPFPRERLPDVINLCLRLREEMVIQAGKAQKILDGEIPLDRWG
jgi:hypothetical protein